MFISNPDKNQIYHVTFEEYLQPKKPFKTRELLLHNVQYVKNKHYSELNALRKCDVNIKHNKWHQINKRLKNIVKIGKAEKFKRKCFGISFKLPTFLAFLRARNDDGLCKRKSGFEIYCEMASIHGFYNFVGATTWQRVFWFSMVFLAILFATIVLIMSYLMNYETPFILSTESTTSGAWKIPFPAVTLCNQNRMSLTKARKLAAEITQNSNITVEHMMRLFRLTLYSNEELLIKEVELITLGDLLKVKNLTLSHLSQNLSPNCQHELLRCMWRGRLEKCDKLFRVVSTPTGICCSFNLMVHNNVRLFRTISSDYNAGLTVLISNNVTDYMASLASTAGYRVLLHDATDFPGIGSELHFIRMGTEVTISITPQLTYSTDYVKDETLKRRRCYLSQENRLETFLGYSFANCLAECRSRMFLKLCNCLPLHMRYPCNATQILCVIKNSAVFDKMLANNRTTHTFAYRTNRYAEKFICNCYPSCSFNQYTAIADVGDLDRTYVTNHELFFKGLQLNHHILLHVYFGDLVAHKLRMDVYENWLSFIGTFGGITGLFMGCSFVSVCEMIFFVLVRPACNWLTKKQIRYRIKLRQKKQAALNAAQEKGQEKQKAAKESTKTFKLICRKYFNYK